jgi:hypothetical protein
MHAFVLAFLLVHIPQLGICSFCSIQCNWAISFFMALEHRLFVDLGENLSQFIT